MMASNILHWTKERGILSSLHSFSNAHLFDWRLRLVVQCIRVVSVIKDTLLWKSGEGCYKICVINLIHSTLRHFWPLDQAHYFWWRWRRYVRSCNFAPLKFGLDIGLFFENRMTRKHLILIVALLCTAMSVIYFQGSQLAAVTTYLYNGILIKSLL